MRRPGILTEARLPAAPPTPHPVLEEDAMSVRAAPRRKPLAVVALLLVASAVFVPARAAFADYECNNVPNCVIVSSGTIKLSRSGSAHPTLDCPSNASYSWGASWDKSSSAVTVSQDWIFDQHGADFTMTNWSPTHRNTV